MTDFNLPTSEQVEEGVRMAERLFRLYRTVVEWIWPPSSNAPPPVPPVPTPTPSPPSAGTEPQPGILIIGPGGTGKTTLARLLAGQHPTSPLELPGEYVESMQIEQYAVKDPVAGVVVPPGQHRHRARDWPQLHAAIAKGECRGIILVTAYGYHSLTGKYKDHKIYKELDKKRLPDFVKRYRTAQQQDELGVLKNLADAVRLCQKKLWFLTVVTKEDLWHESTEVESHYQEADYGRIVKELVAHHGHRQFRADVVLASLVISNFTTAIANELLVKNAAGYDQARQVKSLRRLFDCLEALRRWENE
jgi:hypothetical protein